MTHYRALAPLSYPTDPRIVARLLAGDTVPFAQRRLRHVARGEVVADIPAVSVPWLLEQSLIEEVPHGEVRLG